MLEDEGGRAISAAWIDEDDETDLT